MPQFQSRRSGGVIVCGEKAAVRFRRRGFVEITEPQLVGDGEPDQFTPDTDGEVHRFDPDGVPDIASDPAGFYRAVTEGPDPDGSG